MRILGEYILFTATRAIDTRSHGGIWLMRTPTMPFEVLGIREHGRERGAGSARRSSDLRVVFFPYAAGQVFESSLSGPRSRGTLLHIAPLDYWRREFPRNTGDGVDWTRVKDHLIQSGKAVGEYDHLRVRGPGCWREDGGFVLHLGDRLLPPQGTEFVSPADYSEASRCWYELGPRLDGPNLENELSDAECREFLWLFREFGWEDGISGYLLAGWTVLAPFCGVLDQRPHVWITGPESATAIWIWQCR